MHLLKNSDATRFPELRSTTLLEREDALRELSRTLTASQTLGQFAAVSGEAGVGKTSLARGASWRGSPASCRSSGAPARRSPRRGRSVRCSTWRHDLGGDLEALARGRGAPRHQVFAAFVASHRPAARLPHVVVFEDVHWADEATLDLLRYVGRRTTRIRALIVLTWRADEVGADHPLYRCSASCRRIRPIGSSCSRCRSNAVTQHGRGRATTRRSVFALTGGNPFFVTELLRATARPCPPACATRFSRGAPRCPSSRATSSISCPSSQGGPRSSSCARSVTSADEGLKPRRGRGTAHLRRARAWLTGTSSRGSRCSSRCRGSACRSCTAQVLRELAASADRRRRAGAAGAPCGPAPPSATPCSAPRRQPRGRQRRSARIARPPRTIGPRSRGPKALEPAARAEILDLLAYECYLVGDMTAARDARLEALALWRSAQSGRGRSAATCAGCRGWPGSSATTAAREQRALEALDACCAARRGRGAGDGAEQPRAAPHAGARDTSRASPSVERAIDMARAARMRSTCSATR